MTTIQKLRNGCVAIIALGLSISAQAVTYYWDGTSTGANADGGSGPWNTTSNNWDDAATAGNAVIWPSTGTDNKAVFGGTAGTVTNVAGGVTANCLAFNTANYIITGGPLTLNGTAPSITNAAAATINANLTGTEGLTKLGNELLTLGGSNSGLSGTLTITNATSGNNGGVQFQSTAAFGGITNVIIANTNYISFQGAIIGSTVPFTLTGMGGSSAPIGTIRALSGICVVNGPVSLMDGNVRLSCYTGTSLTFNGPVTAPVGSNRGLTIRFAANQGVIFTNTANYWQGNTTLSDGSVYFLPGTLPASSKLWIAASGNAWFETSGSFTRPLGTTSAGQVDMGTFTAGRIFGLSARGGDLTVNFGGASAKVTWGSTAGFNPGILGLAGANSTGTLTLENPLDLNAAVREINVANGSAATDAIISGTLSGTGSSGMNKTGAGTLLLTGTNTYAGATIITGGKLVGVTGSSCSNSAVTVSNTVGCVLGVSITTNTLPWTSGALTFAGANAAVELDFGSSITPSTTVAPLLINGDITFMGTPTMTVKGSSIAATPAVYPLISWTGNASGAAPTTATLPNGVTGFLYTSGNTLYLQVLAQPLTWDISDTSDQTINDGNGTWNTSNALWNDATSNNANVAWSNTLNAKDTAAFGGSTNGTVTVTGTNILDGITFNSISGTAFYTITGGGLSTTNGDTLLITNNDSGNDRRTLSGATINSKLTGNMKVMFAGAGDNVALGNTANDFVGQIQLNGGGVQISNNTQLGALSNSIEVVGNGSYLRNNSAITMGRDILFSAGRTLQLVNTGNLLTHTGTISGGDSTAQLIIGAAHGPGNGNHMVRLQGTNTMYGTIRIYDQLRAYEGIGLSTNANITIGNAVGGSVNTPNASGILETSGDFVRPLGAGPGQFQWSSDGTYNCGGFSAVGAPLTISFGGLASPTALTWASTSGFVTNVATAELRFQNNNSTHALTWKNPINFNNALRPVFVGASNYETTFDATLSGTGSSGLSKTGTGSLTLAADNTYAGLTIINTGTLRLGNGGATGTLGGGTVTNNAKLVVNRSTAYNLTNLIGGTGTLLKLGAGTLTLSAANTYSGLTTVSNGTLAAGCDLALSTGNALTLSGGTFDAGSASNALSTLTLSTGTTNMMSVNTGTCKLSFTGISGTGTLAITGTVGSKTLRFGTDSTTLTRDQLNLIRANTRKVYLDNNGYLLIIPDGTVIRIF